MLEGEVELTAERDRHIHARHPDLLPGHLRELKQTVAEPDQIRRSTIDPEPAQFARWFPQIKGGRFLVVVIRYDFLGERYWITTAYLTPRLGFGEVEWQRD